MIKYFIIFLLFSCSIEKHDLSDTDTIFHSEENIIISNELKNQTIFVPQPTKILNWEYSDFFSEISDINHYFSGSFEVKNKINFGIPSKNRYAKTSMPIIIDNKLFVCNGLGTLFAFDLLNKNKELWSKTLYSLGRNISDFASFLTSTLSYGDNKIFIATNDGYLIAVDILDGSLLWSINIGRPLRSAFKYDNNVLYGVSGDNSVFAIDTNIGNIIWQYNHLATQKVTLKKPSILLLKDKVVAAFSTSESVALDKKTGKLIWFAEVNYKDGDNMFRMIDIDTTPVKIHDFVMIGGINGNIQFVKEDTGQIISGYFGSLSSSVASIGDFVFFMDKESRLMCFHIPSGGIKWFKQFKNQKVLPIPAYLNAGQDKINIGYEYSGPILIDGKLMLLDQFGHLFIIDPQNGNIDKSIKITTDIYKNPIVVDGKIYLIDNSFGFVLVL